MENKTFEIGKSYFGRFITDSDSTFAIKILDRTDKRIKFYDPINKKIKTVGVKMLDGYEIAYPFGKYSMAPTISVKRSIF